jgi:hypothetical protein
MARRARTSVRAPRSCAVGRRCAVRSTVGRSSDRRACARGTPVMVMGGMTTDCRSARLPCLCALALAAAATVVLLAGCAPAVPAGCAAVVLSCCSRAHLPAEVWSRSRSWRGLPEGVQLPRFLLLGFFGYVGRSSLRVLLPCSWVQKVVYFPSDNSDLLSSHFSVHSEVHYFWDLLRLFSARPQRPSHHQNSHRLAAVRRRTCPWQSVRKPRAKPAPGRSE